MNRRAILVASLRDDGYADTVTHATEPNGGVAT